MSRSLPPMKVRQPSRDVKAVSEAFSADPEIKFTIRIRESFRAKLKALAAQKRISAQQLIVEALIANHPELENPDS